MVAEQDLLMDATLDRPMDWQARLVYADWLEEYSHTEAEQEEAVRQRKIASFLRQPDDRIVKSKSGKSLLKKLRKLVGYTGRRYHIYSRLCVDILDTQWNGGIKNYYRTVDLITHHVVCHIHEEGYLNITVGVALVEFGYIMEKLTPMTVYLHPEDVANYLD